MKHDIDSYARALSRAIPHRLQRHLLSDIYWLRYLALRATGHKTVNRRCRNWDVFPPDRMGVALDFILAEAGIKLPVGVAVDHGCADGHYATVLRHHARKLIGVDILDDSPGYDTYVKAADGPNCIDVISDDSVDLVFIIASVGMHPDGKHDSAPRCGDWEDYVTKHDERQGRYFTTVNYPRVVKPRGHIVIQEWEAYPEQRVGKIPPGAVRARIDEFYPHADIPGFSMVTKGVSPLLIGPYIVYRKN